MAQACFVFLLFLMSAGFVRDQCLYILRGLNADMAWVEGPISWALLTFSRYVLPRPRSHATGWGGEGGLKGFKQKVKPPLTLLLS